MCSDCPPEMQAAQDTALQALQKAPKSGCTDCGEANRQIEVLTKHGTWGRARIMPGGVVVYAKKGFEPPPPLDGYDRDPGDAWKFIPKWPSCKDRLQTVHMKQCGALGILTVCKNTEAGYQQQPVTFDICSKCPFRSA